MGIYSEVGTIRDAIEQLVVIAAGGSVTRENLEHAGGSLQTLGLNSIGFMNLIAALEHSFGIVVDPEEDPAYLTSVDALEKFVTQQMVHPARNE